MREMAKIERGKKVTTNVFGESGKERRRRCGATTKIIFTKGYISWSEIRPILRRRGMRCDILPTQYVLGNKFSAVHLMLD